MPRTVVVTVDVDIDMGDISTEDLREELKERGDLLDVEGALDLLRGVGVPSELLDPLKEWAGRIVTQHDLAAWKNWVAGPV